MRRLRPRRLRRRREFRRGSERMPAPRGSGAAGGLVDEGEWRKSPREGEMLVKVLFISCFEIWPATEESQQEGVSIPFTVARLCAGEMLAVVRTLMVQSIQPSKNWRQRVLARIYC